MTVFDQPWIFIYYGYLWCRQPFHVCHSAMRSAPRGLCISAAQQRCRRGGLSTLSILEAVFIGAEIVKKPPFRLK